MTTLDMTTSDITRSLQMFWALASPESVKTVFSGGSLDTTGEVTWIEFWISQLDEQVHRIDSPRQIRILLDIHLFSKHINTRVMTALIDDVRQAFQLKSLAISSSTSPDVVVGHIRFFEPELRDLSRVEGLGAARPHQHVVVSLLAIATGIRNH